MFMRRTLGIGSAVIFFAVTAVTAQPRKPVVEAPLVSDFYGVPDTLDSFAEKADAAAVVRVQRAVDSSALGRARTTYSVDVDTVLKPHREMGSATQICRPIGRVEQADRILEQYEPRFPAFDVGAVYLLFLRWSSDSKCFWPMYGAPSAALFEGTGRLKTFSRHPALRTLEGLDKASVVARITAARR